MANKVTLTKQENKIINTLFIKSHLVFINMCMINMMGNAFCYAIAPAIEDVYGDDIEGKKEAYQRHIKFLNTHAVPFSFLLGLSWAMEKEHKQKNSIDGQAISSIKAALMGPTAGIFDSLFFNCLRIIAAGIGISLCQQGNVLGAFLFILIYGVPQSVCKYFFVKYGYVYGTTLIDEVFNTGMMQSFTKAASIVGIMIIGAMTASLVNIPLNLVVNISGAELDIVGVLDSIFPGLLSVILIFIYMGLLKKGKKPIVLVYGTIVLCLILALIGLF